MKTKEMCTFGCGSPAWECDCWKESPCDNCGLSYCQGDLRDGLCPSCYEDLRICYKCGETLEDNGGMDGTCRCERCIERERKDRPFFSLCPKCEIVAPTFMIEQGRCPTCKIGGLLV